MKCDKCGREAKHGGMHKFYYGKHDGSLKFRVKGQKMVSTSYSVAGAIEGHLCRRCRWISVLLSRVGVGIVLAIIVAWQLRQDFPGSDFGYVALALVLDAVIIGGTILWAESDFPDVGLKAFGDNYLLRSHRKNLAARGYDMFWNRGELNKMREGRPFASEPRVPTQRARPPKQRAPKVTRPTSTEKRSAGGTPAASGNGLDAQIQLARGKLGDAKNSTGAIKEAEQIAQVVVLKSPKAAAAWHLLGDVRQQQDRPDEAAVAYLKALALDNDLHEACFSLGYVLATTDRLEQAVTAWQDILDRAGDDAEVPENTRPYLALARKALRQQEALDDNQKAAYVLRETCLGNSTFLPVITERQCVYCKHLGSVNLRGSGYPPGQGACPYQAQLSLDATCEHWQPNTKVRFWLSEGYMAHNKEGWPRSPWYQVFDDGPDGRKGTR